MTKHILRVVLALGLILVVTILAAANLATWVEGVVTIPDNASAVQRAFIGFLNWLSSINPAWAPVMYLAVVAIAVGVLLWHPEKGWFYWFEKAQPDPDVSVNQVNTKKKALDIIFRDTKEYVRTAIGKNGEIRKTIHLEVKNIGNGYLSECYLLVENVLPSPSEGFPNVPLFPKCTLLRDQKKEIYLVGFNETITASTNPADKMYDHCLIGWLNNPHYIGGAIKIDGAPIGQPHVFKIVAGSHDCDLETLHLRVWVEMPARKLRAEVV